MLARLIESIRWDQLLLTAVVLASIILLHLFYFRPLQRRLERSLERNAALSAEARPLSSILTSSSRIFNLLLTATMDGKLDEGDINQHLMALRADAALIKNHAEAERALVRFVETSLALLGEYSSRVPEAKVAHSLTVLGVAHQRLDGIIWKLLYEIKAKKT